MFTLLLLVSIESTAALLNTSPSSECHYLLENTLSDSEAILALEDAYSLFLEKRRMEAPDIQQIKFKKNTYEVIDYLGDGVESKGVFRVRDSNGNLSIIKVFRSDSWTNLALVSLEYYTLQLRRKYSQNIKDIDFKNHAIMFKDIRGIPINLIFRLLAEINAPNSLVKEVRRIVDFEARSYVRANEIFDIDNRAIVAIDPH